MVRTIVCDLDGSLMNPSSGIYVNEAVKEFTGKIIAVVHRLDDVEEKWVVAPENLSFSEKEIMEQIKFQEQYFKSEIRM